MSDEIEVLVEEIRSFCADGEALGRCTSWQELEDWIESSETEARHDYDNSLGLRSAYGADLEEVKRGLILDYVARNIARRYVSLKGLEELAHLRRRRDDGELDDDEFEAENQELARDHARLYERLGL